jgi:hypothetical protein
MNLLLWSLACAGGVLMLLGRRLVIDDARSFSVGWAMAIRFLPLADIMYLARFWNSAKLGALMSIAGMVLILPLGAKLLWDEEHPPSRAAKKGKPGLIDGDVKDAIFQDLRHEQERALAFKEQQLKGLNGRLGAWYGSMEARRSGLENATPGEVEAFNEEAAAYAALLALEKEEVQVFTEMQRSLVTNWNQITDEQARNYLSRKRTKGMHVTPPRF